MEKQCISLRAVDPFTDDGVWAIIDDAYNSICHGGLWRKNAGIKWAKLGLKPQSKFLYGPWKEDHDRKLEDTDSHKA